MPRPMHRPHEASPGLGILGAHRVVTLQFEASYVLPLPPSLLPSPATDFPTMSISSPRHYARSDMSLRPHSRSFYRSLINPLKNPKAIFKLASTTEQLEDLNQRDIQLLVDCLVQDLASFPNATSSERNEISNLPEHLKIGKHILPLQHKLRGKLCSMHERLPPPLIDSLDTLLLGIANEPPPPLHLTKSRYFDAFVAMEGVWSEDIEEFSKPTIPNCRLYQAKNCSGCRVRRILSDGLLLDSLLVADGLQPSGLGPWLVRAWEKLTRDVPDQVDHRGEERMNERREEVSMLREDMEE